MGMTRDQQLNEPAGSPYGVRASSGHLYSGGPSPITWLREQADNYAAGPAHKDGNKLGARKRREIGKAKRSR